MRDKISESIQSTKLVLMKKMNCRNSLPWFCFSERAKGPFRLAASRGAGSNCAKHYFSVLYVTLTGPFAFGLGEARQEFFPRGMNARAMPRVIALSRMSNQRS